MRAVSQPGLWMTPTSGTENLILRRQGCRSGSSRTRPMPSAESISATPALQLLSNAFVTPRVVAQTTARAGLVSPSSALRSSARPTFDNAAGPQRQQYGRDRSSSRRGRWSRDDHNVAEAVIRRAAITGRIRCSAPAHACAATDNNGSNRDRDRRLPGARR